MGLHGFLTPPSPSHLTTLRNMMSSARTSMCLELWAGTLTCMSMRKTFLRVLAPASQETRAVMRSVGCGSCLHPTLPVHEARRFPTCREEPGILRTMPPRSEVAAADLSSRSNHTTTRPHDHTTTRPHRPHDTNTNTNTNTNNTRLRQQDQRHKALTGCSWRP